MKKKILALSLLLLFGVGLYAQPKAVGEPRVIAKTDVPLTEPSWSPDGAKLFFSSYEGVWEVSVTGTGLRKVSLETVQLRAAIGAALPEKGINWAAEIIHHTDLETNGDFRLGGDVDGNIQAGAVVGMRLEFNFDDGTQAVTADTFLITKNGAERLTV